MLVVISLLVPLAYFVMNELLINLMKYTVMMKQLLRQQQEVRVSE